MQLLRAGVKLAYLIPSAALRKANVAMHEQGIPKGLAQDDNRTDEFVICCIPRAFAASEQQRLPQPAFRGVS